MSIGIPDFVDVIADGEGNPLWNLFRWAAGLFGSHHPQTGPPLAPPAPPAPPPPPAPPAGGLSSGAQEAEDQYTKTVAGLSATDQKLAAVLKQTMAANVDARNRIAVLLADLQNKQAQMSPEAGDPAAVTTYQQYVDQKLAEVQQILDNARVDAQTEAAILAALGEEYRKTGPAGGGRGGATAGSGGSADSGGSDTGGAASGGESGGAGPAGGADASGPVGAGGTAGSGQEPVVDPLAGMGLPGGLDPVSAIGPALASLGSLPGLLGGLSGSASPLSGLGDAMGGLSGPGPHDRLRDDSRAEDGFVDEPADRRGPHQPASADPADTRTDDPAGGGNPQAGQPGSQDGDGGVRAPAAAAPASAPAAGVNDPARSVPMPDGSVVTAPSPQAAAAMRAVLQGTSVTAAYQAVGVALPPPGSPVTDPVDPAHLEPGCVARFQSREPVLAMGNGKIWLDGQLQPLGALGSGSDFLGWSEPPAPAAQPTAGAPS